MGLHMRDGVPYGGIDPNGIHWSEVKTSVKKNLLENEKFSYSSKGLTFTVNEDKSITISGTASAVTYFNFWNDAFTDYIKDGNYIISQEGCTSTVRVFINKYLDNTWVSALVSSFYLESEKPFTVAYDNTYNKLQVGLVIGSGVTVNTTVKVMIRESSISDSTYTPYISDNVELQEKIDGKLAESANDMLGAKNLLPINSLSDIKALNTSGTWSNNTYTINNITFTVNDDFTISTSGTGSAETHFDIYSYSSWSPQPLKMLSGCPSGGGLSTSYCLRMLRSGVYSRNDEGSGVILDQNDTNAVIVRINIQPNIDTSNLVFKPMIRLVSYTDDTYVPYAKTNRELTSSIKATTLAVDLTDWTQDTTSQSGSTLYKKQISLNHVYVDCPNVDIGCASSRVLPTTAEQEAYNLIQYVTVDSAVPCLYLYASDIPSNSFYIKVGGVD